MTDERDLAGRALMTGPAECIIFSTPIMCIHRGGGGGGSS